MPTDTFAPQEAIMSFPIMDLPAEIRRSIYIECFKSQPVVAVNTPHDPGFRYCKRIFSSSLLLVSKQILLETKPLFFRHTIFRLVFTEWGPTVARSLLRHKELTKDASEKIIHAEIWGGDLPEIEQWTSFRPTTLHVGGVLKEQYSNTFIYEAGFWFRRSCKSMEQGQSGSTTDLSMCYISSEICLLANNSKQVTYMHLDRAHQTDERRARWITWKIAAAFGVNHENVSTRTDDHWSEARERAERGLPHQALNCDRAYDWIRYGRGKLPLIMTGVASGSVCDEETSEEELSDSEGRRSSEEPTEDESTEHESTEEEPIEDGSTKGNSTEEEPANEE